MNHTSMFGRISEILTDILEFDNINLEYKNIHSIENNISFKEWVTKFNPYISKDFIQNKFDKLYESRNKELKKYLYKKIIECITNYMKL